MEKKAFKFIRFLRTSEANNTLIDKKIMRLTACDYTIRQMVIIIVSIVLIALSNLPAPAATLTWDGGGTNDNWGTAANWNPDQAPATLDHLQFAGTTRLTPYNNLTNYQATDLLFTGTAGAFVIGGNTFTLWGGITNNSANTQTINSGINLSYNQSWLANTANNIFNGPTNLGSYNLTIGGGSDTSITGTISGTGALLKSGAGSLTLSGSNTFTGGVSITQGTLSLGSSNVIANTSSLGVASGATFDLNGKTDIVGSLIGDGQIKLGSGGGSLSFGTDNKWLSFSGIITGTGNIIKVGGGSQTLNGTNTFAGTTAVSQGVLRLVGSNVLPDDMVVIVGNGALLEIGSNEAIGSLEGSGNVALGSNGRLTVGGNNTSTTFSGVISSTEPYAVSLTKTGSGVLTLSGSNTYMGQTRINQGTLRLGASNVLPDSTLVAAFFDPATLDLNGFNEQVGGVHGALNISLGNGTLTTGTVYGELTGIISGSGGLTKIGSEMLILKGANTYTGPTIVSQGTLKFGVSNALSSSTAVSVASGATLDLNGFNTTVGSLAGSGNVTVGTVTLGVGANNGSTNFSGKMSGTGMGTLSKLGTGTFTLGAANVFASGMAVEVQGGTLDIGSFSQSVNTVTLLNGSISGTTGTLTANAFDVRSGAINAVLAGNTASLTKTTSGTVTLSGNNTYGGATNVNEGTIKLGASDVISDFSNVTIASGATLDLNGFNETIRNLNGSGNIMLGGGTLTPMGSFSGIISGSGGVIVNGPLSLSGKNTYLGQTLINSTLELGSSNVLPGTTAVTISSSGSLKLNDSTQAIGSLDGNGAVDIGSGSLTVGSNGSSTTYSGKITGTGSFTKTGAGTLLLSTCAGSIFSGSIDIKNGTLQLGNSYGILGGNINDSSRVIIGTTGMLDLNGFHETIGSLEGEGHVSLGSATLHTGGNNASTTFSGSIDGSGGLGKSGLGTMILSGNNTYSGQTGVEAGSLNIGSNNALSASSNLHISDAATLNLNGFHGSINTLYLHGTINLGGGTLTINGTYSSNSSSSLINGPGTVTIGSTGSFRLWTTDRIADSVNLTVAGGVFDLFYNHDTVGNVMLDGGSIISHNNYNEYLAASGFELRSGTVSAVLAGTSASLTKTTDGTVTLSGINTYRGATNISQGTLKLGVSNALTSYTAVSISLGATLDLAGFSTTVGSLSGSGNVTIGTGTLGVGSNNSSTSFNGTMSGSGGLVKFGNGTFTLNGGNVDIGTVNISEGTVSLSGGTLKAGSIANYDTFKYTGGNLEANITNYATGTFIAGGPGTTIKGILENYGIVSPGSSPGFMNLTGDYNQYTTGRLIIELGGLTQGVEYDWLNISGQANLLGWLDVDLYGGFNPNVGDEFTFLTATGGRFGEFEFYDLPFDRSYWNIIYGTDYVKLAYLGGGTSVPEPATMLLTVLGLIGIAGLKRRLKG